MAHLRGMTWDHPRGFRCLEAASQHYARAHGVSISWDRRSLQAFADLPVDEIAGTYDLIVLDHPHVGLIAENECLLPLDPPSDPAQTSIGGSLESYVWDGELWAYPIDAACQVAVQRPDLDQPNFRDWDAVLEEGRIDGTVTPLLPVDAFDLMMTLIASRGEEGLPVSDQQFCSDESGLAALRILKALYRSGPAEASTWNPVDVLEAMSGTDDFAYCPALFGYINYARPGFRAHRLQYADLPSFRGSNLKRGILGGAGIGVSSETRFPESAKAFASWVASEPVQSGIYLENEGQPGHRATWFRMAADPRYAGFFDGARHTMEHAWTRPRETWFLGFVDAVCEIFPDFFGKNRDERDFLNDVNALYRQQRAAFS